MTCDRSQEAGDDRRNLFQRVDDDVGFFAGSHEGMAESASPEADGLHTRLARAHDIAPGVIAYEDRVVRPDMQSIEDGRERGGLRLPCSRFLAVHNRVNAV